MGTWFGLFARRWVFGMEVTLVDGGFFKEVDAVVRCLFAKGGELIWLGWWNQSVGILRLCGWLSLQHKVHIVDGMFQFVDGVPD